STYSRFQGGGVSAGDVTNGFRFGSGAFSSNQTSFDNVLSSGTPSNIVDAATLSNSGIVSYTSRGGKPGKAMGVGRWKYPFDYEYQGSSATANVGEQTIATTTITANTIKTRGVRIIASGYNASANGNKTIKLYFGNKTITFHPADNNEDKWRLEADIALSSNAEQYISTIAYSALTIVYHGVEDAAQDMTSNCIVKITGECAHADDEVILNLFSVKGN
ncbi:unnamed protein product, partial [marine sediment metagenome]